VSRRRSVRKPHMELHSLAKEMPSGPIHLTVDEWHGSSHSSSCSFPEPVPCRLNRRHGIVVQPDERSLARCDGQLVHDTYPQRGRAARTPCLVAGHAGLVSRPRRLGWVGRWSSAPLHVDHAHPRQPNVNVDARLRLNERAGRRARHTARVGREQRSVRGRRRFAPRPAGDTKVIGNHGVTLKK
jgi:hypothetical protein